MSTAKGLELLRTKYNLANGWRYGGGHQKRFFPDSENDKYYTLHDTYHTRYFRLLCETDLGINAQEYLDSKPQKDNCLCEHYIQENCFIYKKTGKNKYKIKVLGNCCIRRLELNGRRCSICHDVHRNRKHNYCNTCNEELSNR